MKGKRCQFSKASKMSKNTSTAKESKPDK